MLTPSALQRPWIRAGVALLLFVACTAIIPRWWCAREGRRWYAGDAKTVTSLARHVAATVQEGVKSGQFTSDSSLFRNEWLFGTYQMAALGLLQVCREHPELTIELRPAIESAIAHLLSDEVRAFDAQQWGEDPLASLDSANGHAAYLGYLNIVLSLDRATFPDSRHSELNDRISAALARRLRINPYGLIETYPGEAYPVDIATGLVPLLLHQQVTGIDHSTEIARTQQQFELG